MAGGGPLCHSERKTEGPADFCATRSLPVRTQETKHRASRAWRDIRPRGAKAESFRDLAPEPRSGLVADSPMYALSVLGTRTPRAAYRDQAGDSQPCPRTPTRSRLVARKPGKRPGC